REACLLGIPATGRQVKWDAVDIYRVDDDGKISEEWASDDMAAFASQLGAIQLPWAVSSAQRGGLKAPAFAETRSHPRWSETRVLGGHPNSARGLDIMSALV